LFGDSIVNDAGADLIPIFFDLGNLPLEPPAIMCGVSGQLVDEVRRRYRAANPDWELACLSTARASTVILPAEDHAVALDVFDDFALLKNIERKRVPGYR